MTTRQELIDEFLAYNAAAMALFERFGSQEFTRHLPAWTVRHEAGMALYCKDVPHSRLMKIGMNAPDDVAAFYRAAAALMQEVIDAEACHEELR